ncbi:MAG: NAD(+) synthase [Victivallaceae bacterium]|nr:NAD(+) synthase [Victivallaceae bacterium]
MQGFYRVAAAVPALRVGDVAFNTGEILRLYREAAQQGAAVVVFPELSLTGYSCGDLFAQETLLNAARDGMLRLAEGTKDCDTILIAGAPLEVDTRLFNVAAVMQHGAIRGFAGKTFLPDYREFYEKRQFRSIREFSGESVLFGGEQIALGNHLVFQAGGLLFGAEICEDLWCLTPPSTALASGGAQVIFNLSAGNELVSKAAYRRELVRTQSARLLCGYVLAGAGVGESSADVVFSGHALIAVNGALAAENKRFDFHGNLILADVPVRHLTMSRRTESSFNETVLPPGATVRIALDPAEESPDLAKFRITSRPFVPADNAEKSERCEEILNIQSVGLARRMRQLGDCKVVVGLSGGLDSTLALLAAERSCKLLDLPASEKILAVTMPGFGTTSRSRNNAETLTELLHIPLRNIPIADSVMQHFRDIGHDPEKRNLVYENAQARERTQILMDLSNAVGGIVLGTGDLSEIALGWNTFNGDQMSMYAVNCSVPKTLVKELVEWIAAQRGGEIEKVLRNVTTMPYSPELLPGEQITEQAIGSYLLHDFFLYYFLKYGSSPEEIQSLAEHAFGSEFSPAEIRRCLEIFLRRFFGQQFKRNAVPDGPKVGTIALSPRGDWRMPSDAADLLWKNSLR